MTSYTPDGIKWDFWSRKIGPDLSQLTSSKFLQNSLTFLGSTHVMCVDMLDTSTKKDKQIQCYLICKSMVKKKTFDNYKSYWTKVITLVTRKCWGNQELTGIEKCTSFLKRTFFVFSLCKDGRFHCTNRTCEGKVFPVCCTSPAERTNNLSI